MCLYNLLYIEWGQRIPFRWYNVKCLVKFEVTLLCLLINSHIFGMIQ